MSTPPLTHCPNCGGNLLGDGFSVVVHCEAVADLDGIDADANPVFCPPPPMPLDVAAYLRAASLELIEEQGAEFETPEACKLWLYKNSRAVAARAKELQEEFVFGKVLADTEEGAAIRSAFSRHIYDSIRP